MKKVLVVVGTRPEAIKLAPVILELKAKSNMQTLVCTTGQHRQMLDQVLELFHIQPDIDLNIMQASQTLSDLTARVITQMNEVLKETGPDLVLVQGDTTTIMASAMACFFNHVLVGHVEAGLRSYNMYSPFPEEMNRKVASVLASYHFAPTERAKQALISEGVSDKEIFVTGNTVVDSLLETVDKKFNFNNSGLSQINFNKNILLN